MDVGLIYSSKDPEQRKTKDFVCTYIRKRGILANIKEIDQEVDSPTVIINGHAIKDERKAPRQGKAKQFPDIKDIARFLEHHFWSL